MKILSLNSEDEEEAIDILVQAFHDDPVMNWISDKPIFLHRMFALTLPLFLPKGLCCKAQDSERGGMGVAVWLAPGEKLQWPFNLSNIIEMLIGIGLKGAYRLSISGIKTEKFHPSDPHYYLFAIGALPDCRGQGVGTALMSHMLRQCDKEGMPAYLENSKEENLAFYQGHGFEIVEKVAFTKNAPNLWLMWREPRSVDAS